MKHVLKIAVGMPLKLVIIRSNKGKTTSREIFDSIVECHKENLLNY